MTRTTTKHPRTALQSKVTTAPNLEALASQIRSAVLADIEDARLRELAADVIRQYSVPARDTRQLARAFQLFAQDRVKYFREHPEYNAAPWVTARWGIGDCDDKSRLIAALCKQFKMPTRLVFATFKGKTGVISHVWPEVQLDGSDDWIALESVRPWPMGKNPLDAIKAKGYPYKVFELVI